MKTTTITGAEKAAHILATFETLRAKLPKRIDPARVTVRGVTAEASSLRVCLDGRLVADWCYAPAFGWTAYESGVDLGPDGRSVYRAAQAAMKAHR